MEKGLKGRQDTLVTEELTAVHVGSGLAKVYATPMMLALMEKTCMLSVAPFLQEGEETVGTLVEITHNSATPVGMKVYCESELIEIDRRRLVFKVSAYDERGLIGEGTHERFIVNGGKFQQKADAK